MLFLLRLPIRVVLPLLAFLLLMLIAPTTPLVFTPVSIGVLLLTMIIVIVGSSLTVSLFPLLVLVAALSFVPHPGAARSRLVLWSFLLRRSLSPPGLGLVALFRLSSSLLKTGSATFGLLLRCGLLATLRGRTLLLLLSFLLRLLLFFRRPLLLRFPRLRSGSAVLLRLWSLLIFCVLMSRFFRSLRLLFRLALLPWGRRCFGSGLLILRGFRQLELFRHLLYGRDAVCSARSLFGFFGFGFRRATHPKLCLEGRVGLGLLLFFLFRFLLFRLLLSCFRLCRGRLRLEFASVELFLVRLLFLGLFQLDF